MSAPRKDNETKLIEFRRSLGLSKEIRQNNVQR